MADYSKIAVDFDKTRGYVWPCVKRFLDSYPDKNAKLLEAGCGNGRNLLFARDLGYTNIRGFDICAEFVDICLSKGLDVHRADILEPIDGRYDIILCVAVIHHIGTLEGRQLAFKNMMGSLNPGGIVLFSVWSYEKYNSKAQREFKLGDNYIPWHSRDGNSVIAQRYYHIYNEKTLKNMLDSLGVKYELYWEEQNWIVTIKN